MSSYDCLEHSLKLSHFVLNEHFFYKGVPLPLDTYLPPPFHSKIFLYLIDLLIVPFWLT